MTFSFCVDLLCSFFFSVDDRVDVVLEVFIFGEPICSVSIHTTKNSALVCTSPLSPF